MIEDIIKEIQELNHILDLSRDNIFLYRNYKSKRDELFSKLQKEVENLRDFEVWKEWKK